MLEEAIDGYDAAVAAAEEEEGEGKATAAAASASYTPLPSASVPGDAEPLLRALAALDPIVGYCQSLNSVAAMALLVLGSEADAFFLTLAVCRSLQPPGYYSGDLAAARADALRRQGRPGWREIPSCRGELRRPRIEVSNAGADHEKGPPTGRPFA